jgi:hypothetical protein
VSVPGEVVDDDFMAMAAQRARVPLYPAPPIPELSWHSRL